VHGETVNGAGYDRGQLESASGRAGHYRAKRGAAACHRHLIFVAARAIPIRLVVRAMLAAVALHVDACLSDTLQQERNDQADIKELAQHGRSIAPADIYMYR
jgi:hypothetical protein